MSDFVTRQWSDLGPIKIFKFEFESFHVILLITCIKITYTISSQLAGDTFDKNYIWCDLFNFVQSYFFCLPWFIFLGDSLCFLDSWYVIQCAQRRDVIEIIKPARARRAAFTGRRNSYSGRGEDFLSGQPNFFYGNSCNSGTESRKMVSKVGN